VKVLLDACVWRGARVILLLAGHDVVWVGDWPKDPGDEELLRQAALDGRVLVTLDKDFGELVVVRGAKHVGIVRLVDFPAKEQGQACARVLARYAAELEKGALVTADPRRVRVRTADDRSSRRHASGNGSSASPSARPS